MVRIAIVEDEPDVAKKLEEMLLLQAKAMGQEFHIRCFDRASEFLSLSPGRFDLAFMDIQMPEMDGMTAAARLRQTDHSTVLIFVTGLAQYAIAGYEVEASDFLVKPVDTDALSLCVQRALKRMAHRQERKILLVVDGVRVYLPASEIFYVEVRNHQLIYHAASGDYLTYEPMSKAQKELEGLDFFRCNSCYLVNLRYVQSVEKFTVKVHDTQLQISHPKKKAFLEALNRYIGG